MARPKSEKVHDSIVRISKELASKGRTLATAEGITAAAYFDRAVEAYISSRWSEYVRSLDDRLSQNPSVQNGD